LLHAHPSPGAAQRQIARGQGQSRHDDSHHLKAPQFLDNAAAYQGKGRPHGAEEDLPGHYAHPLLRRDRDLRQQGLEGAAGEGAEKVEALQHREQVDGIGDGLVIVGRRPEEGEEQDPERRRKQNKGDAPAPAAGGAVAPVADERVIEGLNDAGRREDDTDGEDGGAAGDIGFPLRRG
jgi:hypothetical protein